tara:strand:- start:5989 stop:6642 length:654 start_codon:yes stop_codon:yes gene_type:complete
MIGCVITTHQSDIRPTGHAVMDRCVQSLERVLGDECGIIVVDNGSPTPYHNNSKYDFIYRPEQLNGLTGGWNMGVSMAYEMGYDIICVMSDDIYFNDSFKKYEKVIDNHDCKRDGIFGTLTDSRTAFPRQVSDVVQPNVIHDVTNQKFAIHGWLFGFSRQFFVDRNVNGMLFDNKYPFGGNEQYFQQQAWKTGARSFVIGDCLVHHEHLNAWKKIKP